MSTTYFPALKHYRTFFRLTEVQEEGLVKSFIQLSTISNSPVLWVKNNGCFIKKNCLLAIFLKQCLISCRCAWAALLCGFGRGLGTGTIHISLKSCRQFCTIWPDKFRRSWRKVELAPIGLWHAESNKCRFTKYLKEGQLPKPGDRRNFEIQQDLLKMSL